MNGLFNCVTLSCRRKPRDLAHSLSSKACHVRANVPAILSFNFALIRQAKGYRCREWLTAMNARRAGWGGPNRAREPHGLAADPQYRLHEAWNAPCVPGQRHRPPGDAGAHGKALQQTWEALSRLKAWQHSLSKLRKSGSCCDAEVDASLKIMQMEEHLFPGLLTFGEGAGMATAESGEGALQIELSRFLPTLLESQVPHSSTTC